ncbi:hypothetical protein ACIBEA_16185 [Streptomyces sp. NPDC051555]|uniref:hypothetical protein n=1 Tax=Streptomyces sp. NPDC051555 TaxID=3365657 RepID=UPI00378C9277
MEEVLKTFEDLATTLALSGITLLGIDETVTSCPPDAASQTTACGPWDGRVDEVVEFDSPDPLQAVDEAWWRLACQFDLFGAEGEFLLLVNLHDDPYDSDSYWARVRLQEKWTVAGSNSSTINGPSLDGLITMSPTGTVIIEGSTYQDYMSVLAVPSPHRASAIRKFTEFMLREHKLSADEAESVARWLAQD